VGIIVEEEAIEEAAVATAVVAAMLAKEAKEEAILVVAKVARTTSIQTSIARYMADKDMTQSTVAKLQAKEKKKKAAMDLESQIGHINQALNVTKCP